MNPLFIVMLAAAWLALAWLAWAFIHGAQKLHRAERAARELALAEETHPAGLTVLPRSAEVFDVEKHAA